MKTIRIGLLMFSLLVVVTAPTSAYAYIGPGAGLSAIGGAIAFVAGILLAIVGFIWYPVKRLLQMLRRRRSNDVSATSNNVSN